jgi:DNA-binding NarL/FixJ family response regulator
MLPVTKIETRVLIVDDHPFMRRGLAQTIKDQPGLTVCGEAGTIEAALELIESKKPQVAVVDISLGGESGIELIETLRKTKPEVRVLVSSMHDESLFAERAIRAGALGYVNKGEPPTVFIDALLRVRAGETFFSDRIAKRLQADRRSDETTPTRSPISKLSNRELEVYDLIGRGKATRQIAAQLGVSKKTVEAHREHIKQKLNLNNATQLTQSAVQWVLEQGRPVEGDTFT